MKNKNNDFVNIARRRFSKNIALGALGAALMPIGNVSFANVKSDKKFIFLFLRGAVDGLAMVPPYKDQNYKNIRGELALTDYNDLDGFFGLHPSLTGLHSMYKNKEAIMFHAVATPYSQRSHFEAQNVVEGGGSKAFQHRSGWINRLISAQQNINAMSVSKKTPYIIEGKESIASWFPKRANKIDPFLEKLKILYKQDKEFNKKFDQAIHIDKLAAKSIMSDDMASKKTASSEKLVSLFESVSKIIKSNQEGFNVTFIDIGGWDTHANQGTENGQLARKFKNIDNALALLPEFMDDEWKNTNLLVTTEFGRTVRPNGTRGTDHGNASCSILLGGNIKGGKVITKWPGLAEDDLHEDRDLKPTIDMRSLFKTVLHRHLGVSKNILEKQVFPDSSNAGYIKNVY